MSFGILRSNSLNNNVIAAGPATFTDDYCRTKQLVLYKNHKGEFVVSTQTVYKNKEDVVYAVSDEYDSGTYFDNLADAMDGFADRIKDAAYYYRLSS